MRLRALIAELVGTFILIAVGSLSIVSAYGSSIPPIQTAPFGFGLALMAGIVMFGHISGAHFNPAVTLAAWIDRRITLTGAIGYVVAQVIGAMAGSMTIFILFGKQILEATVVAPANVLNDAQAFGIEAVLTAIFVAVILTVTARAANQAVFVIPLTLVLVHFAAVPISGAAVNPVRALAPAVIDGNYDHLWVYLVAPLVGAIVAWGLFRLMAVDPDEGTDADADAAYDDLDDAMDAAPGR